MELISCLTINKLNMIKKSFHLSKRAFILVSGSFLFLFGTIKTDVRCDLITDQETYWPAPHLNKPGYLQTVTDPTFGTKITRIVGEPGTPLPNVPGQVWASERLRHGYSKRQVWNSDQSMIFLDEHIPNLWLDGNTYEVLFTRPDKPTKRNPGGTRYHVRWSHSEPNIMYYILSSPEGCHLGKWDVVSDVSEKLIDLENYTSCSFGRGEGNFTADGVKAAVHALRGDGERVIFVADMVNKTKGADIKVDTLDNCTMSPLGNYIVIDGDFFGGSDRIQVRNASDGTVCWTESRYGVPSHFDVQIDQNGDEVVVGVAKTEPYDGSLIKRRLSDGFITVLIDRGYASHTSGRNLKRPGWVYVTYSSRDNLRYYPYQNEIIAVKLDGSRIERICNTRSYVFTYISESHGCPSPDGLRVIFASDWDSGTYPVQAYVVDFRDKLIENIN